MPSAEQLLAAPGSEVEVLCRAIPVRIARHVSENGAPEEIRTPDPQIRSLVLNRFKLAFVASTH
jgi:hypothetical protein